LELRHKERAAGALHLAHRRGGGLRHRRERLRLRLAGDGAQSQRAQARHQLAARHAVIEILLDEVLHAVLPGVIASEAKQSPFTCARLVAEIASSRCALLAMTL